MTGAGADSRAAARRDRPAICGRCYEVPAQLQGADLGRRAGGRLRDGAGQSGNRHQGGSGAQLRAGVRGVSRDPRCTAETPALYSYRRDGRTGRFAGLVWLA